MKNTPDSEISVVMIAGRCRSSAQKVLDALERQTCPDGALDITVFDCGDESLQPLRMPTRFPSKMLRHPGFHSWRVARARAARQTTAPVVAFVEDHCEPHPDWAERLINAHADRKWAMVGYAFTNGSRDSWWSHAAFMLDYGLFAHPFREGQEKILAGNNTSYARWFLEELGTSFEQQVAVDYNWQQRAIACNYPIKTAPDVRAAHRSLGNLMMSCKANFHYARILSFARARDKGWSLPIRVSRACGGIVIVPLLRMVRLTRALHGRPGLMSRFLKSLPVFFVAYSAASFGEAAGYLFGLGDAEDQFMELELNVERLA